MLEDARMDKKSVGRSSQSKPLAVDCKKTADSTHKPSSRYSKKRETTSSGPKNEGSCRKNGYAPRGRGQVDRRPRPRGSAGLAVGGTESPGLVVDEPELGSVFVPGSKKQNLTHLLNFSYSPRGGAERNRVPAARRPIALRPSGPLDRDLYLQASCQFVVKEGCDYSAHFLDPDIPVKWDHIEEIVVRSWGRSECPVCLGPPVAGRVAHCGHVHCWPCALHYADTHERRPPPCPVCAQPFRIDQLKPARIQQWEAPSDEVCMRLARRRRGTTLVEVAAPRDEVSERTSQEIQAIAGIGQAPYAKLFTASKQQVREILHRERRELSDQIMAEIDTSELVYLEQALDILEKKEQWYNIEDEMWPKAEKETQIDVPVVFEKQQDLPETKLDWFNVTEDNDVPSPVNIEPVELLEQLKIEESEIASALNPNAATFELGSENTKYEIDDAFPLIEDNMPGELPCEHNPKELSEIDKDNQSKYFYFYQAEDGQHIFLHGINVRLLNASWGSLAAAPRTLRAAVLRRETSSLTEQVRKHMPCAAHLPLYCPFEIVELDLRPPYVTTQALESLSEELERRARARARLEKEERRRERAARRALEGPPKPDLFSEAHFPPAQPTSPPNYNAFVYDASPPLSLTAAGSTGVPSSTPPGLSFAKMAGASGSWRVRSTRPPTPPPPVEEPHAPRVLSLSDAIEAALAAPPATLPSRSAKKKSKPKVLFATGMQRTA